MIKTPEWSHGEVKHPKKITPEAVKKLAFWLFLVVCVTEGMTYNPPISIGFTIIHYDYNYNDPHKPSVEHNLRQGYLGGGFKYFWNFHPLFGEMIQIRMSMFFFEMGWFNHQPEAICCGLFASYLEIPWLKLGWLWLKTPCVVFCWLWL